MAQAKIRMRPGQRIGITSSPIYKGPQATAAAFIAGAPVKLASGDLSAVSAASSQSSITFAPDTATLGIASGVAAASSTGDIGVTCVVPGQTFQGNLIHGTASSAKVSKVGSTVYLGKHASDTHWGWSLTAPGTPASYIAGLVVGLVDPASTVNGRVEVAVVQGGQLALDPT
jgi:hypothetical protein